MSSTEPRKKLQTLNSTAPSSVTGVKGFYFSWESCRKRKALWLFCTFFVLWLFQFGNFLYFWVVLHVLCSYSFHCFSGLAWICSVVLCVYRFNVKDLIFLHTWESLLWIWYFRMLKSSFSSMLWVIFHYCSSLLQKCCEFY